MMEAVIFDLDGTLLNTLEDIHFVVNRVFLGMGLPEKSMEEVKHAVGRGVEHLVRMLMPCRKDDGEFIIRLADSVRSVYLQTGSVRTRPYPGVPELLVELQRKGVPMAVLTNKPQLSADESIETYFGEIDFRMVRGAVKGVPLKPSREASAPVIDKLGSSPGSIIMVGDSDVDMDTAVNAGMIPVGVSWGFRDLGLLREHGAKRIIDSPSDLLELLDRRP